MSYLKNFAQFVTEILSGEKSGRKTGVTLNIVQKNALLKRLFLRKVTINQTP